jgi:hypothetical protein
MARAELELKTVLDTIRIVCVNVEADLAAVVADELLRPREAKKVIANVLAASGSVTVSDDVIRIRLAPAANRNERVAIEHLFATINEWSLTMPGDRANRRIEVILHLSTRFSGCFLASGGRDRDECLSSRA